MQKFRISKKNLEKALNCDFPMSDPEEFILEGELLEGGGTVEKVGWVCKASLHPNCLFIGCACECHNKKEEKVKCICTIKTTKMGNWHSDLCPYFNRETPKENISGACQSFVHETCAYKGCVCNCHIKEEVKLPEEIDMINSAYLNQENLVKKFNELLRYLASKGDKLL